MDSACSQEVGVVEQNAAAATAAGNTASVFATSFWLLSLSLTMVLQGVLDEPGSESSLLGSVLARCGSTGLLGDRDGGGKTLCSRPPLNQRGIRDDRPCTCEVQPTRLRHPSLDSAGLFAAPDGNWRAPREDFCRRRSARV